MVVFYLCSTGNTIPGSLAHVTTKIVKVPSLNKFEKDSIVLMLPVYTNAVRVLQSFTMQLPEEVFLGETPIFTFL